MERFESRGIVLVGMAVLVVMLAGCRNEQLSVTPGEAESSDIFRETADPAISRTLQAEVALTAAWLLTLTPAASPSGEASPTVAPASSVGTPVAARSGTCSVPGGYVLQDRQGFCLVTPSSWVVFNIDGGVASVLKTTPGQVVALKPDWAYSTAECNLLVYIAAEDSVADHLEFRHRQFASQKEIEDVSAIQACALGQMGIQGFTWRYENGDEGAVYADMVGPGRLLHISYDGSDCLLEDMLPVLETLRVN